MSGNEAMSLRPPEGMYGADGMRIPQGLGAINPANLSMAFGESDPMGTMPAPTQKFDPRMLQMMMSMRGMGQPQSMGAMPSPQPVPIQPGAMMGAMPQMPQGGFRPRGMAGRF